MSLLGPQTSSAESCCNLNMHDRNLNMHDRNLHGSRRGDKESLENEEKTNKKTEGEGKGWGQWGHHAALHREHSRTVSGQ